MDLHEIFEPGEPKQESKLVLQRNTKYVETKNYIYIYTHHMYIYIHTMYIYIYIPCIYIYIPYIYIYTYHIYILYHSATDVDTTQGNKEFTASTINCRWYKQHLSTADVCKQRSHNQIEPAMWNYHCLGDNDFIIFYMQIMGILHDQANQTNKSNNKVLVFKHVVEQSIIPRSNQNQPGSQRS
jgi:hypothetical protein